VIRGLALRNARIALNHASRYISESELKQEILHQEREMMRRVKLRDNMRGAMASSSVIAVSTKISSLIECAMNECCAMLERVNDKTIVLEERQVTFVVFECCTRAKRTSAS
jgi:hypothetical protein